MRDLENTLGFGLAGNFAHHLEQAGEASDFAHLVGEDADAPKGMFPFYVPGNASYLGRFCFDNEAIILPRDKSLNVQAEPEVALKCELVYSADKNLVENIVPTHFMAFNDASVRNDKSAKKLSQKKNFSLGSKGFGASKIAIPKGEFTQGGICDSYSIASFICTQGIWEAYGEASRLDSYSYFYETLTHWMIKKLNFQEDFGVLQGLYGFVREAGYPTNALITIGATRYVPKNEKRFLAEGDIVSVAVFNHKKYSLEAVERLIKQGDFANLGDISILKQKVIRGEI